MERLYDLCLRERFNELDEIIANDGLKGLSLNAFRGASNRTILHCAVSTLTLHLGLIRALIASGASVNETDVYGNTPLVYVSKRRVQSLTLEVAELLLNQGADVCIRNRKGETVMTSAALNPYLPPGVIGQLLRHGGNMEEQYNGKTVKTLLVQSLAKNNQPKHIEMIQYCSTLVVLSATLTSSRTCKCKTLPSEMLRELKPMFY